MGKEDGADVLADLLTVMSFTALFFKIRLDAAPQTDDEKKKPQPQDDLSTKAQILLLVSYAIRYYDKLKAPRRSLEALAKFQHALPPSVFDYGGALRGLHVCGLLGLPVVCGVVCGVPHRHARL